MSRHRTHPVPSLRPALDQGPDTGVDESSRWRPEVVTAAPREPDGVPFGPDRPLARQASLLLPPRD